MTIYKRMQLNFLELHQKFLSWFLFFARFSSWFHSLQFPTGSWQSTPLVEVSSFAVSKLNSNSSASLLRWTLGFYSTRCGVSFFTLFWHLSLGPTTVCLEKLLLLLLSSLPSLIPTFYADTLATERFVNKLPRKKINASRHVSAKKSRDKQWARSPVEGELVDDIVMMSWRGTLVSI